jgi:membrane protease subunit HflK
MKAIIKDLFLKSPWDDIGSEQNIFTRPRKKQFKFDDFQFQFNKHIVLLVGIVLFILWLFSGIYEVKEGEEAAVIRFGRFVRKGMPGLNYRLPRPIELEIIEKVNQSRRIEIGYRSSSARSSIDTIKGVASESIMLTGDENIVDLNCDVMWHINDLEKFKFNVDNPAQTVKTAAESAVREIIGKTPISSILSDRKQEITNKIEQLTQKILDHYGAGVSIETVQLLKAEPPSEVIDAYRDVQTSRADKEREINQAQSYNNDVLPRARGEAAKMLQEAEGYKQEIIAKADGDSQRFSFVYKQYINNKQLTKDRLYLEAMNEVLSGSNKVIMGADGVLPHMSIGNQK